MPGGRAARHDLGRRSPCRVLCQAARGVISGHAPAAHVSSMPASSSDTDALSMHATAHVQREAQHPLGGPPGPRAGTGPSGKVFRNARCRARAQHCRLRASVANDQAKRARASPTQPDMSRSCWHPPWGSNPRPHGYGPCALPTGLGGLVAPLCFPLCISFFMVGLVLEGAGADC